MVHEIENFYGVYLLYNMNPKFKGRTYIGYTVDPNRRIKQHNLGKHAGGACRTDGKGPWEMVLIIHGFPNEISGLRFEWAWQHPDKSRRLRHLPKKAKKELQFDYRFRIVSEMLRVGPWNRLTLTVRWLKQEFFRDFDPTRVPPLHMAIAYGPVKSCKVKPGTKKTKDSKGENSASPDVDIDDSSLLARKHTRCAVCFKHFLGTPDNKVSCIHPKCSMVSHMLCLSKAFLSASGEQSTQIIPVQGKCPKCSQTLLWGDVIRHKHGCYFNLTENSDVSENDHWADELQSQVM